MSNYHLAQHPMNSMAEVLKSVKELKTMIQNNNENMTNKMEQNHCSLKQDVEAKLSAGFEEHEGKLYTILADVTNTPLQTTSQRRAQQSFTTPPYTGNTGSNTTSSDGSNLHLHPIGPLDSEWMVPLSDEMSLNIKDVSKVVRIAKQSNFMNDTW